MSKNLLVVFGATGQQGGSIIRHVLDDPELSQKYTIRGITRHADSVKAQALREKQVEVVEADMSNRSSLEAALDGAHTVYIMTIPSFGPDAVKMESNAAKLMADVAVAKGAQYIIFSTLPSITDMSGGKYTHVSPFDAKAEAEKYIRSLPVQSAFCALGSFMENFHGLPIFALQPVGDGTWVMARPVPSKVQQPLLYASGDTGKFVGAILAEPEKYVGKTLYAATAFYSMEEMVTALAKHTGKAIVYKHVPVEEFSKTSPFAAEIWIDGMLAQEEYGYFGLDGEKLLTWSIENARGKLTSLDEYLETHPFHLE